MKKTLKKGFCPKTGRAIHKSFVHSKGVWFFLLLGLLSLGWFMLRVIPKPSRASYPCMRIASPLASSFVTWLLGIGISVNIFRKGGQQIHTRRYLWALIGAAAAVCLSIIPTEALRVSASLWRTESTETSADPPNEPIGIPRGCSPGRVVWVHNPDATDWDGPESGQACWEPGHIDQAEVDKMMSQAICWLAGESDNAESWDRLFRYTNQQRNRGNIGYQAGEKIAVKINLTTCNQAGKTNMDTREKTTYLNKAGDTTPHMILALLRQLVNVVGVRQTNISIGDPVAFFPSQWYDYLAIEFPDVHYLDHYAFPGRTRVQHSNVPLYWSTADADGKLQDYFPLSFVEAAYLINFAVLKGHERAGITVCAKNHYGSLIRTPVGTEWGELQDYYNLHESLPAAPCSPGRGKYRALVDLMGHAELGGKTVLFLIDGLYGGYYWEGTPYKWNMAPFKGDWPSSLFASQDPVAIDSVAYDFLSAEWPDVVENGNGDSGSLQGGAQDYLHEAALASDPPSGTFYDPEKDGAALSSLGVHEHWNNSTDKQYSRNLEVGDGIELISSEHSPMIGDFNGDSAVDLTDCILASQILSGMGPPFVSDKEADVNNDRRMGTEDLVYVLQEVTGLR